VIDADGNIIDPDLHLDGELSIGPSDECSACHGQGSLGAPPPSLSGATDRTDPIVGLHAEHLTAGAYGEAMPCSGCHLVPTGDTYTAAVAATGHMDSARPAELFGDPSGLAFADGAQPTYDVEAGTCSNTYCHGGGQSLFEDDSASVVRTLPWSPDAGTIIFCGSCHGIAPTTPEHPTVSHRTTCGFCHPDTVDSEGQIIVGPEGSTHINGVVDL
jgi:predicted CxxxxCH...CXXCH cytochrome family protein